MTCVTTDELIAQFVRRWARFDGGPTEEIFVTFGLTPADYYRRLQTLVRTRSDSFADGLADVFDALCTRELAQRTPLRPP